MTRTRVMGVSLLAVGALFLCSLPATAANNTVQHATAFAAGHVTEGIPVQHYGLHLANPARRIPKPNIGVTTDQATHHAEPYSAEFSLNYHVLGVGHGFPNYSVPDAPPDTTLAVGDTEVVQWVNVSYADFNKATGAIIPLNGLDSTQGNTIWHNLLPGTLCANNNDGDIIVKFDRVAHRWFLTQNVFVSPYATCIAVSQTATFSDNLWYAYQYPVYQNGFPDYPKWGIWSSGGQSDGYYSAHNDFGPGGSGFQGSVACAYHRSKLLAGDSSAEQICHLYGTNPNYQDSLLPGDRESFVSPPANQDEFYIGSLGDIDNSHLSLYNVKINDWSTGNATFGCDSDSCLINIATFNPACNGNYGGACVPQEGTTDKLDSLGDRLMYRFVYWEDQPPANATATPPIPAPTQHWYVAWDVTGDSGQNAVRWMEIQANLKQVDVTALENAVFQQGTYQGSPADSNWRWMGTLSTDKVHDILVGFSESNTNEYPSIAAAGRKFNDALGTLSAELYAVQGSGGQPDTGNRWGDYSTMAIDPSDNCTFFYTTEYYQVTATFSWSTDISSWKFPNCH